MEFIKLNIDKKLNLDEIAQEYKITTKELQQFHNSHCKISEYLPLHLAQYVEVIYLPRKVYEERVITLLPSRKITLPKTISNKKYGVIIRSFPKELQIHYTINIKREHHLIYLERDKMYVNNKEIEKTIEQLLEKSQNALFPLALNISNTGELLSIHNLHEIKSKWQKDILPGLKEYYVGEYAEEIINKIGKGFENLNNNSSLLYRNLFYKLFFAPIYQNYPEKEIIASFSIYNQTLKSNIDYLTSILLDKDYTRGNKIRLEIKGTETANPFEPQKPRGEIAFTYKLHKETHEIFSITGHYSTYNEQNEKIKVDFEMYEL